MYFLPVLCCTSLYAPTNKVLTISETASPSKNKHILPVKKKKKKSCPKVENFAVYRCISESVTHPDKHLGEWPSGVFGHVDWWDDPVSLLPTQTVGGRAPQMLPGELDESGLRVPCS